MISPFSFLLCNLFITILLAVFLLLKHCCKKHLTAKSSYQFWYVFAFVLLLPFIPYRFSAPTQFLYNLKQLFGSHAKHITSSLPAEGSTNTFSSPLGLSDYSQKIGNSRMEMWNWIFLTIWGIGCIATCTYFLYHIFKIYMVRKASVEITKENEPDLYETYTSCMQKLKIRRQVSLYASCTLSSPVSYGILWPKIIIPQDMDILLSKEEVSFIFLHELQHYKRKDAIFNVLSCLFKILYWFNPFIWYAFSLSQKDREVACDHCVLDTIGKENCVKYGYTLIHYIEKMQTGQLLSPLSHLGGRKHLMLRRIKEIAGYRIDGRRKKLASIGFLLLACVLVYFTSPFLNVAASQSPSYRFSYENIETLDLESYFQGTKGSFVLYDVSANKYQIYNKDLSTRRVSPDSTFKIYSGLFALEEGIIDPASSTQKWDNTVYTFESWNQDQTLYDAMKNSVNWYFQNLDLQMGYSKLYSYYNQISYGNCDLSGGLTDYWAESSLKISPVEQVILLANLLENKWNLETENLLAMKKAIYVTDISNGHLYGKTGTGLVGEKNVNGWFVGFLEREGKYYCFATNLQDSEIANGNVASQITVDILNSIL